MHTPSQMDRHMLSYRRTYAEASKVVPEKLIETLHQSHLEKFVRINDTLRAT